MNRWQNILDALLEAGIDVYAPGGHRGICTSPYCVVRQTGGFLTEGRSGYARYRVHLLVPASRPCELERLAEAVRCALMPMEEAGIIILSQPRGATVTDDDFDALSSLIDYVSYYSER